MKPVHTLTIGGDGYTACTGLLALPVNVVIALAIQVVVRAGRDTRAGTA